MIKLLLSLILLVPAIAVAEPNRAQEYADWQQKEYQRQQQRQRDEAYRQYREEWEREYSRHR